MSQPAHPPKRRRAVLACHSCRHRKSRCDGGRPCTQCKELGCDCVYQDVGASNNLTVEKSYLARLEHRIQDIEASIRRLEQSQGETPSPTTVNGSTPALKQTTGNGREAFQMSKPDHHAPSSHAIAPGGRAEFGEIDTSENSIDGMGAMNFTDEEDCPSSNIAFMRHISRALARGSQQRNGITSISSPQIGGGMLNVSRSCPSPGDSRSKPSATGKVEINIFALPSEQRTWHLVQIYFEKTGQLLPFIHESSFCETYFRMKEDNFKRVRRTWLGLLNIILAIATSLHTEGDLPAGQRIQESDIHFQRANGLCDKDSKRNASLEMVQYLLVLGQYLQGTQKSVQAWTTHGLAISAAFQLGLHSPEANRRFSPVESEIRKRTWYGCILLDRTLSMTFGRPCTIPESYVKLDMPVKDMQVLANSSQSDAHPQLDGWFFTAAIQNLGFEHPPTAANAVPQILEGERQLEEWRFSIVPSLGIRLWHEPLLSKNLAQLDPESTIRHRFGIVLSVRYHNLRILLYRRFLESYLDSYNADDSISSENKLVQQMGFTGVQNCVESAISIISTVYTITSSGGWHRGLLGAWYYSLYYTFNAGLVIFGALLVSSKERQCNPDQWRSIENSRQYLDLAADALRHLDSGNRVIERCVEYLAQLSMMLKATTSEKPSSLASTSNVQAPLNGPPIFSADNADYPMWSNVDLGEFMMDNDLDFLGQMFNLNHPHGPSI
ncbi:transcriptional regulatory protein GAL4 [Penicillium angulare]|uniref:transcriptional regulatory protein GAL4 n=1 Tax=Penicillium angulare TaxID=116970 RepID=UPI002540B031|nr:transcriptional regulatory protein GAL4 [Penicillium angulare]KAJ5279909.1 transcriptional regulatory protein GAL4 [Penicillium angulare]